MNGKYIVEVLTPKLSTQNLDDDLQKFAEKFRAVLDAGFIASIPDNPMGIPRFKASDVLSELGLPIAAGQVLVHLNTFHTLEDFDSQIELLADMKVSDLLLVTGDGSERFGRLPPSAIGAPGASVTSVDLIRYVRLICPAPFSIGAAFNHYEPPAHETDKLLKKLDAGAEFVITQPVIGFDPRIMPLARIRAPVYLGAWMSGNLALLQQCVGYPATKSANYNPVGNVLELREAYGKFGIYFSMLRHDLLADIKDMLPEPVENNCNCCCCNT